VRNLYGVLPEKRTLILRTALGVADEHFFLFSNGDGNRHYPAASPSPLKSFSLREGSSVYGEPETNKNRKGKKDEEEIRSNKLTASLVWKGQEVPDACRWENLLDFGGCRKRPPSTRIGGETKAVGSRKR
jgi:hypothetical protein